MARPREFDEKLALMQAMNLFWSKGYESTSLAELLKVTGLSRSSLYDTFGSKRQLFLAAFEVYRLERMRVLNDYLTSEPTAYASIKGFFSMVLEHARMEDTPFGCMSCNEAVEFGPHDAEVQRLVEKDFLGVEDSFASAIEAGKKDGSIPKDKDARKTARFLTVTHQGLQTLARSNFDMARLEDATSVMLASLQ